MQRIELSPLAALALRELPVDERRRIAERIGHLETGGLPVAADGDDPAGCVLVPAGNHVLVCVPYDRDRSILIATIEPAQERASQLVMRWSRGVVRRTFRGVSGRNEELYAAAWPRSAGAWSLRNPMKGGLAVAMMMETRRAIRAVTREPGVAVLAVAALSLGIGLTTAMFGVLDALLLRGLPIDEPREIQHMERRPVGARGEGWGAPIRDYIVFSEQQQSFEGLGAFYSSNVALRAGTQTDRYNAAYLTTNSFALLRSVPALGRVFGPADGVRGEPPVILGHHIWRDRFASDPNVIGERVWIDGNAHTVAGVMPERFRFPFGEDIWLPMVVSAADAQRENGPSLNLFGRLKEGQSLRSARSEFDLIAARMIADYPETEGWDMVVKPYTERFTGETATTTLWVFFAAVMLVLVIACTNVANLLLVRAVHRVRDLAVRSALGAGRGSIMASLLLEAAVLAVLGGAGGLLVALAATGGLRRLLSDRLPFWAELQTDVRALGFVALVTVIAALVAGVLPALRAMRPDVRTVLQDETRGSTGIRMGRIMQALVVIQIALSLALLVATGLLIRGIGKVRDVALGFDTEHIFTARVTLPASYDSLARATFWRELQRQLEANSGAASVSLASAVPVARAASTPFAIDGESYDPTRNLPTARQAVVSSSFFETFSVQPVRGRTFGTEDGPSTLPVILINERFAARYFPRQDPLGRRIRLGNADASQPFRTIVGVVPDLWMAALDASGDRNPAGVYIPLEQALARAMMIAARTRAEPLAITSSVRETLFAIDRDVPIHEVRSMPQLIEDNSWFFGMGAAMMGTSGAAALILATIGLYGVVAFSVGRRTREIGIRMAVGAVPRSIVLLMLRRGLLQLAAGTLIGLALAVFLARGIASLLFNVSPTDVPVFATVSTILVLIAVAATLVPAIRAARIHPLSALRTD